MVHSRAIAQDGASGLVAGEARSDMRVLPRAFPAYGITLPELYKDANAERKPPITRSRNLVMAISVVDSHLPAPWKAA